MPPKFVHGLRACCVAVALLAATARGAEPAQPPSPVGLTRDQVLQRYGEPRSQLAAGNRLVMLFAKERLILRDGVVVEVERLPGEAPVRRPPPAPAPAPTPATTEAAPPVPAPADRAAALAAIVPAPVTVLPNSPIEGQPPIPEPTPPPSATPATPATPATATAPTTVTPPPEPKVEIKLVRPPSANYTRPSPKTATSSPQSERPVTPVVPDAKAPKESPAAAPGSSPAMVTSPPPATVQSLATPRRDASAQGRAPAAKKEIVDKEDEAGPAGATTDDKKKKAAKARRKLMETEDTEEPVIADALFNTRNVLIAFLVTGGGIGYIVWRSRQRQLELAASAVSSAPFSGAAATTATPGVTFTADILSKLEWKRFEELVAAYYSKTGVVAERAKNGPSSPVHIKISWKGEPRPFAFVQCLSHPVGLIDSQPLQELVAVLAKEDIRRGYTVTTGKFNVNARDFAEEKHITLLPGDIFLEKLNALPEAARSEIMQVVVTGDYQTPSCPKCDAKMVRSPDDPATWRCTTHPEQVIPSWS